MKKIVCLLLFTSLTLITIQAQETEPDADWIIKDGMFFAGSEGVQLPEYGTLYTFDTIPPPNTKCNPEADDDIFAIFSDGTYFNSRPRRLSQAPGKLNFKYEYNSLQLESSRTIKFMCLTEVYDDGGRPTRASRSQQLTDSDPQENKISGNGVDLGMSNDTLSANRIAVPGRDITLIVDLSKLEKDKIYRLTSNEIEDSTNAVTTLPEALLPTLFSNGNSHYGPARASTINQSEMNAVYFIKNQNSDSSFLYFNLKVNPSMNPYALGQNKTANQIVFELRSTNASDIVNIDEFPNAQTLSTLDSYKGWKFEANNKEEIRSAHDPNHIHALTMCEDNIVQYEISFFNSEPMPADHIACELYFPPHLKIKNACVSSTSYQNNTFNLDLQQNGNQLILKFDTTFSCIACEGGMPNRVNINLDIQFHNLDHDADLAPSKAYTIFNTDHGVNANKFKLKFTDKTCNFDKTKTKAYPMGACKRKIQSCETCIPPEWPGRDTNLLMVLLAFLALAIVIFKWRSLTSHNSQDPEDS